MEQFCYFEVFLDLQTKKAYLSKIHTYILKHLLRYLNVYFLHSQSRRRIINILSHHFNLGFRYSELISFKNICHMINLNDKVIKYFHLKESTPSEKEDLAVFQRKTFNFALNYFSQNNEFKKNIIDNITFLKTQKLINLYHSTYTIVQNMV